MMACRRSIVHFLFYFLEDKENKDASCGASFGCPFSLQYLCARRQGARGHTGTRQRCICLLFLSFLLRKKNDAEGKKRCFFGRDELFPVADLRRIKKGTH